ncbi:MAG TPA: epoxyqueuosine reductase, partial [Desulfomonilia bacterium]|nr:epoxyqueuosine reductase [Desulfomonilia bacterium]
MDMKDLIRHLLEKTAARYISSGPVKTSWQEPLVGYAGATDPLFRHLKQVAHPGHLLPSDLLEGAKTVVAYFLPFTKSIVKSNIEGERPSRQWADAYLETNELIMHINADITAFLGSRGYRTCTVPPTHNFDPITLTSTWSHRHVAYIAGLGTFGLNRMLITERGCCGRLGSLVTDLEITPVKRIEGEYCLHFHD